MMRASIVGSAGTAIMFFSCYGAAQAAPLQASADSVLARACSGNIGKEISQADLAEAILIQSDVSPRSFIRLDPDGKAATGSAETPADEVLLSMFRKIRERELIDDKTVRLPFDSDNTISGGILNLEMALKGPSDHVDVKYPPKKFNLFTDSATALQITCKTGKATPGLVESLEVRTPPPRFALREKPEELWLTGEDGRKAGAFTLSFEQARSQLEDGTRKRTTDFSVSGTVGYRLTPDQQVDADIYAFATYALERQRTRPKPELGEGEKQSDGDTNVLNAGVDGKLIARPFNVPTQVNLQASGVFDFANESRRLKLRLLARPGLDWNLGVCRIGSFLEIAPKSGKATLSGHAGFGDPKAPAGLRTRCDIAGEVEGAHVLKHGTSKLGDHDIFLAAGGRASFELFLPMVGEDTGFLASVNYRYLPVLDGKPDDLERLEFELKHRFWTSFGAGIDVGFSYAKGTNELSFEDEDLLKFGLGLVF